MTLLRHLGTPKTDNFRVEPEIQIPFTSQNFAIRAASNDTVTLHFDATDSAAFFYKFSIAEVKYAADDSNVLKCSLSDFAKHAPSEFLGKRNH